MTKRSRIWGSILVLSVFFLLCASVLARRIIRREYRRLAVISARAETPEVSDAPQAITPRAPDFLKPERLDAWQIIGPGGGGTFEYPAISPHDSNLVFATTDMTSCFVSENGGRTWRTFELRGTCRFAFDAKLPNRVYANSMGFYRSDDRGHTWSMVYPAGTVETHYHDDEGEASLTEDGRYRYGLYTVAADPDDSDTLYGSTGEGLDDLGLSRDGGKTWKLLCHDAKADNLWVDPTSPREKRTVYVRLGNKLATWDGTNYTKRTIPGEGDVHVAFGVPSNGGKPIIYVTRDSAVKDGQRVGGVMATTDGGQTWKSLNAGISKIAARDNFPYVAALGTSLKHAEVVYAAYTGLAVPGDEKRYLGVLKSTDAGSTWSVVRQEANTVAPNMHNDWTSSRFSPDFGDLPMFFAVDDNNPDLVYTGDLARLMRSVDGGKNWYGVFSQSTGKGYTTTGLDDTTCYSVHFDPFDPKHMFITYTDIGLMRSDDGGESWVSATVNGVPHDWRHNSYWVEFDPAVKGKVWAVMTSLHDLPFVRELGHWGPAQGGVAMSLDGGVNWTPSKGLPASNAPTHIMLDPRSPVQSRILYVASMGRGVYRSSDGGQTWVTKNEGLPANPLAWHMAIGSDGTLYLVTIRRSMDIKYGNDNDGWLFRSFNGANSWEKVPLPPGLNGPMGITVDPKDPTRLYVSAWGRWAQYDVGPPAVDGGVFLSEDAGLHWRNVLNASRRIYDVTVDPHNPDVVYASGFENAAYRSTDRGHNWSRIAGFNFTGAHRIAVDPVDPSQIYITTMGNSVWHGPAAGDPKAIEDIVSPPTMRFQAPPYQIRAQ